MKIAILGAAGKAGSRIARTALDRGHSVTAVVRPSSVPSLTYECPVLARDLMDLTADDLRPYEVVIDAVGSHGPGTENEHIATMRHLISVFRSLPTVRLLVVGGAGSLFADEYGESLVMDAIPETYRAVPLAMAQAFQELRDSGINWTYFSPAVHFDPDGRRTGKYILGNDYILPNSMGESRISYDDYAIAMVDEAEQGRFIGQRFTAVSDTSALERDSDFNLFNLAAGSGFLRRGSYFGVYFVPMRFSTGGMSYASNALEIASRRGAAAQVGGSMLKLIPTYKGHNIPYAIRTAPAEMTLVSLYGTIRFCFARPNLLLIKGEGGLGLKLETNMHEHQLFKKRGEKAWEELLPYLGDLIINPLQGSIDIDAPYVWEELTTPRVRGEAKPDADGRFLLSLEEFTVSGVVRDSYPTYEEGLADVTADWESFLSKVPPFPGVLEQRRLEAVWTLWSYLVGPSGLIKRPLIYMTGKGVASAWQMCQNAVALHHDIDLAVELLLNMLDQQFPTGQLPDLYDDLHGANMTFKPPLQGWALKWIMKSHDLKQEVPREKLERMYEGFLRWADWFFQYRDDDHDGLPQYEHGDETGFDDNTIFERNPIMKLPDLPAYLALTYEALADLGRILGRDEDAEKLMQKSRELIDRLVRTFWNGERFIALTARTHEVVATDSLLYYLPIVLGKRLPQEIIDRIASDLSEEGEFLTGYGLASERLTGDGFRGVGYTRGAVLAPTNLLILTGLYDAGYEDLAKKIALRYCTALKNGGFNLMINPMQGNFGGFACSWPACAYVALADMISM
ncbi:MAG: NAD(P)H-binding protein [Clostridia bacterium]|nr:NAD(P)H-binding protein [Clostridia bacterium]